eukprot:gene12230-12020_t
MVLVFGFQAIRGKLAEGSRSAVSGSLLAAMNTASEYGFGAVIASLPGFLVLADWLKSIPNPLVNEAITVTLLAGITGSASGGMSIALAAMANDFIAAAHAANIPLEVLHRVAAMASGGMDTLPHNGAVITLLAVTGLTHREAYKDIFCITLIKTLAVFVVIGTFYATGITALVTGSTSGIGLGIALSLAKAGANLILNGFGDASKVIAEVEQFGGKQIDDRAAKGIDPQQAQHDLLAEKQPSLEFVTPPQLGELVLFLCSEAGTQVRGAAWNIDGGWLAQ